MKKRTSASKVVEKQVESGTRATEGTRVAAYAGRVKCPECAHECEAGACTTRADGSLECPECAAIVKPLASTKAQGPGPIKTPGVITCGACGSATSMFAMKQRADGDYDCPDCKAVIDLAGKAKPKQDERPPRATELQPDAYCNECGAKWERVDGKPWPNCGHKDGFVYDPSKARNFAPPAGTQRVDRSAPAPLDVVTTKGEGGTMLVVAVPGPKAEMKPAKQPPMPEAISPPTVGVVVYPDRVEASWGKSMFRLGDFQTFTIGEFKVTRAIDPGASAAEAGDRAMEQLEELATRAFRRTLAWYLDKLGLVSNAIDSIGRRS